METGRTGDAGRVRADQLAAMQGICPSRAQARQLIEAGQVLLPDGTPLRKPGQLLPPETRLRCDAAAPRYVSRGALKLLPALEAMRPPLEGAVALDLGASTGGFTEVLLQRGVRRVYAVDVGHGQLHQRLRDDVRVVNLEGTNAKGLDSALVPEPVDILVADLSFISLTKALPPCAPLLSPGAWVFTLVKPQFEAGREAIGSGGIVRDPQVRRECVERIVEFCRAKLGWRHCLTMPSPIPGGDGNQEFIAAFRNGESLPQPERGEGA